MGETEVRCEHCGLKLRECAEIARSSALSLARLQVDQERYSALSEKPADLYAIAFEEGAMAAIRLRNREDG